MLLSTWFWFCLRHFSSSVFRKRSAEIMRPKNCFYANVFTSASIRSIHSADLQHQNFSFSYFPDHFLVICNPYLLYRARRKWQFKRWARKIILTFNTGHAKARMAAGQSLLPCCDQFSKRIASFSIASIRVQYVSRFGFERTECICLRGRVLELPCLHWATTLTHISPRINTLRAKFWFENLR